MSCPRLAWVNEQEDYLAHRRDIGDLSRPRPRELNRIRGAFERGSAGCAWETPRIATRRWVNNLPRRIGSTAWCRADALAAAYARRFAVADMTGRWFGSPSMSRGREFDGVQDQENEKNRWQTSGPKPPSLGPGRSTVWSQPFAAALRGEAGCRKGANDSRKRCGSRGTLGKEVAVQPPPRGVRRVWPAAP